MINNPEIVKILMNPIKSKKLGDEIEDILKFVINSIGKEKFKEKYPTLTNFINKIKEK